MSVLKALKTRTLDAKTSFIIYEIKSSWWKLKENNLEVKFLWTPSHIGVQGNESADQLAKSIVTADTDRITGVAIPHTDLYSILKQQLREEWKMQWNAVLEAGKGRWYASINSELNIPWFSRNERYHCRKFYTIMCRLRFGHYRLNAHLSRMKIVASATCSFCHTESDQTAEHIIFDCPAYAIVRLLLIEELMQVYENSESVPRALQDILRNTDTYLALYNFIHHTVKEI
ncbi:hypothetical protein RR46_01242 [Papilio xuthus]|uniref:Uncharacterized protein n=1 Tax=Papilio xuthus TaxID=66420 RepID=A0A0N1PF39_PAPXU|nr:hypothetical protein RR46_01242 [Papilio xuthus]